jgi:sugar phosphate permease
MGQWTTKSKRGAVSGLWATCTQFGNILGIQLSVLILNTQGDWEYMMFYIFVAYSL